MLLIFYIEYQYHVFECLRINKRKKKPKGNQEWTIQRNWQHWVQKTQS